MTWIWKLIARITRPRKMRDGCIPAPLARYTLDALIEQGCRDAES